MKADKFQLAKSILAQICTVDKKKGCEQLFCKLHEKKYLGAKNVSKKTEHNCLACQLNDGITRVHRFLNETDTSHEIEYSFTGFMLLLYLEVEKLHTIFKFIGITWEYVDEHWNTLVEIRKWANFIKHPKGFLFTHHPKYVFETDKVNRKNSKTQIIDFKFVTKFYFREDDKHFQQSLKEVGNKKNLIVIIPNPDRIAHDYVKICKEFCEKIRLNEHFKTILKKHSTINDWVIELNRSWTQQHMRITVRLKK